MFVREDAFILSLSPFYRGPYLILERRAKFFRLQLGDRKDVVSVYRLKPAYLDESISPALPPLCCHPAENPALAPQQIVRFSLPPEFSSRRNTNQAAGERRIYSSVTSGWNTVADPCQPVLVAGLLFSTQQQLQVIYQ